MIHDVELIFIIKIILMEDDDSNVADAKIPGGSRGTQSLVERVKLYAVQKFDALPLYLQ